MDRSRKGVRILLISLLLLCNGEVFSQEARKEPCDGIAVPEPVLQALAHQFSAWRALRLSDLDPSHQGFWLDSKHGRSCPGIAIGHFESKSRLSYAFLLIPKQSSGAGYKLVVVSDTKRTPYNIKVLEEENHPGKISTVVYSVSPGKYSDAEEEVSVQIPMQGIQSEQMEVGAVLFYWKNGKYHSLVVSN